MNLVEFLASLAKVDIRLWVDSGNLRFSAAEGAMTEDIKQQIIANKADIIAFLQQSSQAQQSIEITKADRSQQLPLSYAQERFWFLYQLEPESSAYNMAGALRIKGLLRIDILNRALTEISRRHEILRTRFVDNQGITEQHIDKPASWGLVPTPLPGSEHVDTTQTERLDQLIYQAAQDETSQVFNLTNDHPIRGKLHTIGHQDHLLLMTLHHIACDGWSLGVLVSEIAAIYNAITASMPIPLPALPIQYADYAIWQREHLSGDELTKQQSYWQDQLAGLTPLNLSTDFARPPIAGHHGDSVVFTIGKETTLALNQLAKQQGATLFMTLMAAFKVLLSRYSRQDDICIGTPVANRNQSALEPLIGCFLNTLAMRTDLSGKPSFIELLTREQVTAQNAFEHQDIPFAKVVDALNLPKDMAFTPVYQTLFVLQNAPTDKSIELPGLTIEPVELEKHNAQFDLKLSVNEHEGQLVSEFEYRTDLFQKATVLRMAQHFTQLLNSIVKDPQQDITQLTMITEQERDLLLSCEKGSWNDTANNYQAKYGNVQALHQLFEQQAAKTPDAIAVQYQQKTLSYQALNEQANQLAHYLVDHFAITADTPVALCMQRSIEMSVALLGVLKAGGCYLPCDPSLPKDRLGYMLEDTKAPVVISQTHLNENLPESKAPVIWINEWLEQQANNANVANREIQTKAQDLINIIYTSGSTGKPKGVMVPHAGIINRLLWMQETYPLSGEDVVLQKTPYSFDVSVWELFWPLITGAKLIYAKPEGHKDPDYLRDIIIEEDVTTLHFVPSMLGVFLQAGDIEQCRSIKRVFCSGEALQVEHQRRFLQRLRGKELHNLYGPTEASIDVSYYACTVNSQYTSVPIGKPVTNTQLHVLDEHLQPMPVGVPGELYIGGIQLARGYLNREDLTHSTFIDNPYHQSGSQTHPSPKLYKTGDLARWLPDGNIEYIGRTDHQVKIRGLRIELGEIEAELAKQDTVKECVVVASELASGTQTLVAYLMAKNEGEKQEPSLLNQALSQNLPDYMIPAVYMWLDAFPLSPNGKLDRKALPTPDFNQRKTEYIAPTNEVESLISRIWQTLLQVKRVGITDNFFELGGHSLLATQFVSRLREETGYNLPLKTLFTHTTIQQLAQFIEDNPADQQNKTLEPIPKLDAAQYPNGYPLSYAQQRLWLIEKLMPGNSAYHMPAAVSLQGQLNISALEAAFDQIIQRHEALRTQFIANEAGEASQQIASSSQFNISQQSFVELSQDEKQQALTSAYYKLANSAFDLVSGPLIRAQLIKLADNEYALLVCLHHIIADGWSVGLLIQEVAALYPALNQQQNTVNLLPPLPIQYRDFAVWQRNWLANGEMEKQLSYWQDQLSDTPLLTLPTDYPRHDQMNNDSGEIVLSIDTKLLTGIKALAKANESTLFMVLEAAFAILMSRYSGQNDICIGTPIANRTRAEVEPMIGFFVNTLAIRHDLSTKNAKPVNFNQVLSRTKNTLLAAYENQDVPFEQVVEAVGVSRNLTHTPLFQVMFMLQNTPQSSIDLPELSLKQLELGNHPTKFDLTVSASEVAEGLHTTFRYRASLFNKTSIQRIAEQYQQLLSEIIANPEKAIDQISLLTEKHKHEIIKASHGPITPISSTNTILSQYQKSVNDFPDRAAVVFSSNGEQSSDTEKLSFKTLNEKANQIAHWLVEQGAKKGDIIGLHLQRGTMAIASIWACWKQGLAYLPLDPDYPQDRLVYMLEDSGCSIIIDDKQAVFTTKHPLTTLNLSNPNALTSEHVQNSDIQLDGNDLAYIIYTSGTTGQPKGVKVPHKGIYSLGLALQSDIYQGIETELTGTVNVAVNASMTFDSSVKQLIQLAYGHTLYPLPQSVRLNPAAMASYLATHHIQVLDSTPSQLSALISYLKGKTQDTENQVPDLQLQKLLIGGEAIQAGLWQTLSDIQSSDIAKSLNISRYGVNSFNVYGPTECTVDSTWTPISGTQPHIGKPIANMQAYILDQQQMLTPDGIVGELYIGGIGVTDGYLGQPELTAERFIDKPSWLVAHENACDLSLETNSKLYRTGDLVRRQSDGTLEYRGRVDNQIKLRGFRIELGDIEAAVTQQEDVHSAAAKVCQRGEHDVLVCYCVLASNSEMNGRHLRKQLLGLLPDYMVPAAYIPMDALPQTPNGKIDYSALPAPDFDTLLAEHYVAPRNETESQVTEIWQSVLNISRIGVEDNFFELGGQSLLATQVLAQIQQSFNVEIELKGLFEEPTIANVAQLVDAALIEKNLLLADDDTDLADDDEEEFLL